MGALRHCKVVQMTRTPVWAASFIVLVVTVATLAILIQSDGSSEQFQEETSQGSTSKEQAWILSIAKQARAMKANEQSLGNTLAKAVQESAQAVQEGAQVKDAKLAQEVQRIEVENKQVADIMKSAQIDVEKSAIAGPHAIISGATRIKAQIHHGKKLAASVANEALNVAEADKAMLKQRTSLVKKQLTQKSRIAKRAKQHAIAAALHGDSNAAHSAAHKAVLAEATKEALVKVKKTKKSLVKK